MEVLLDRRAERITPSCAARDAIDDRKSVIAGTFDDVVHGYDRSAIIITTTDYAVLV